MLDRERATLSARRPVVPSEKLWWIQGGRFRTVVVRLEFEKSRRRRSDARTRPRDSGFRWSCLCGSVNERTLDHATFAAQDLYVRELTVDYFEVQPNRVAKMLVDRRVGVNVVACSSSNNNTGAMLVEGFLEKVSVTEFNYRTEIAPQSRKRRRTMRAE